MIERANITYPTEPQAAMARIIASSVCGSKADNALRTPAMPNWAAPSSAAAVPLLVGKNSKKQA
ncbi:hypothetical protein HORIV_12460 [Vreelandella olivaria]|uniref:Uncharacterized protein n=1 Tax=Vreelandella olivaria TaxID=390919 RepID=A0ABN5WQM4_9GAMM|nr:hypothetical protein HORIV_12460 [Halomonas olivaria]